MKKFARTVVASLALVVALSLGAGTDVEAAKKKNTVKKIAVSAEGLSKKKLTIAKGKSKQLTVAVNDKAVKTKQISKNVTVKSNNSKIVKVTKNGKLTAKKVGTAKVTVTSKKNKKKKVTITVKVVKDVVKKVTASVDKTALKVGDTAKLTYKVSGKNKKSKISKTVSITSSDKNVVTVTGKGVVTAVGAGTAKITVKALDGSNEKATVTVTVEDYKTTLAPKSAKAVTVDVEFSDVAKLQQDVDTMAKAAVKAGDNIEITLNGKKYVATYNGTNVVINGKKFTESVTAKDAKKVTVTVDVKTDKIAAAIAFAPASVTKVTVGKVAFTEITATTFKMNDKTYTYAVDGKNIVVEGNVSADFDALKDYVDITVK